MSTDRLPRDWRVALAVFVGTLAAYAAAKAWVVSIARAEDYEQRAAIEELTPMVREMYWACVGRGECKPPPLQRSTP